MSIALFCVNEVIQNYSMSCYMLYFIFYLLPRGHPKMTSLIFFHQHVAISFGFDLSTTM